MKRPGPAHTDREVKRMGKKQRKKAPVTEDLRLDPSQRLVSKFDSESIAEFPVGSPKKMGMRVRDNCAEENIR